ncbi:hypothetical protein [Bdellovibrio sp. HCB209]|uniref:hypothetical protein n=1 Tax=Bdellovibrio sp. HCB209 TaxID=3394354 RepID=UPI0039B3E36F
MINLKSVMFGLSASLIGILASLHNASAASPTRKISLTLANGSTGSIAVYFDAKKSGNVYITRDSAELYVRGEGPFTKDDVGKTIGIVGAGPNGRTLTTTIKAYVNSQHVTLSTVAATTSPRLMTGKGKMVAGSATLVLPNSTDNLFFTYADAGKNIWVSGAGAGGAALRTKISSIQKPDSITLAAAASTNATNVDVTYGTDAVWGNDDYAAINAAIGVVIKNNGGTLQFPAGNSYISRRLAYKATAAQGIKNFVMKGASGDSAASALYFADKLPWDSSTSTWVTYEDPLIEFGVDMGSDNRNNAGLYINGITLQDFTLSYMLQSNLGGESDGELYKTAPKPMVLGVFSGIYINFARNVVIRNLDVHSIFGRGISVRSTNGLTIDNNHLVNVGGGDPAGKDTTGDAILVYSSVNANVSTNSVKNYRQYVKHNAQSKYCTGSNAYTDDAGNSRCRGYAYDSGKDYYGTLSGGIGLRAEYRPGFTPAQGEIHMPPGVADSVKYTSVKFFNNSVQGFTMGIKSENGVSMEATQNVVYGCYIGILHTDIGSPKIKIINNQVDDKGVGSSPQAGFTDYAAGIAITRYGNDYVNGDNLISGNKIVGQNNGIVVHKSNTYIWGNTITVEGYAFRTYGAFKNIVLRNNVINGTAGVTYGGSSVLVLDHNTINGSGPSATQIATDGSGGDLTFTNNIMKNMQVRLINASDVNLSSNTFSGSDQCYITRYNSPVTYSSNKYSYTKSVSCSNDK